MSNLDNAKIKKLIHSIGLNNNLSDSEVKKIVESQFEFTYNTIINIELEKSQEETLDDIKTNFIYKYLGKLHTNKDVINKYNKLLTYRK